MITIKTSYKMATGNSFQGNSTLSQETEVKETST